jgi:hypothetical protein
MPVVGPSGSGGTAGVELNYTQITSSVTVTSTTEATGTSVFAPAAVVFDGQPVLVTMWFPEVSLSPAAQADAVFLNLFEGATQIGRLGLWKASAAADTRWGGATILFRFSPSAASHTYTVTAFKTAAGDAAGFNCGAGGTGTEVPAFFRITKV